MTTTDFQRVLSRADMTRMFDGYSFERREELDDKRTKRPFVKTYLLEVLDGSPERSAQNVLDSFRRYGVELRQVDALLYQASQGNDVRWMCLIETA